MLHPAVSLFLWGLLAILAQLLPAVALCAYAAVCAAVALFLARGRLLRLLKRSRYLLLALVVAWPLWRGRLYSGPSGTSLESIPSAGGPETMVTPKA